MRMLRLAHGLQRDLRTLATAAPPNPTAQPGTRYEISVDELAWLGERVAVLQTLVETVCQKRLSSLLGEAPAAS